MRNLAWSRKLPVDHEEVQWEYTEIITAVEEEEALTAGVSMWREITAKGNPVRFIIAFVLFTCQQWSGQNSISYYAPTSTFTVNRMRSANTPQFSSPSVSVVLPHLSLLPVFTVSSKL